jgi:hypothetical protein
MMDKPISSYLRNLFLVHMVITFIIGASIWLVPGRTLLFVGWEPEMVPVTADLSVPGTMLFDPFLARILGAALLALAFSSYRGWRAHSLGDVVSLVWLEAAFCVLGVVGVLYTAYANDFQVEDVHWVALMVLVVFSLAWGNALRQQVGE